MIRRCVFALFIGVLLALGSVAVAPRHVQAVPYECCLRGWTKTYYNNAAHSTAVGEQSRVCSTGRVVMIWGTTSAYYTQVWFECP
ncbi:MAG TPA: hypothetical protein VGD69_05420 [Herpetosiphonaceae bacterium]